MTPVRHAADSCHLHLSWEEGQMLVYECLPTSGIYNLKRITGEGPIKRDQ